MILSHVTLLWSLNISQIIVCWQRQPQRKRITIFYSKIYGPFPSSTSKMHQKHICLSFVSLALMVSCVNWSGHKHKWLLNVRNGLSGGLGAPQYPRHP